MDPEEPLDPRIQVNKNIPKQSWGKTKPVKRGNERLNFVVK
jgi:hypothetical protein